MKKKEDRGPICKPLSGGVFPKFCFKFCQQLTSYSKMSGSLRAGYIFDYQLNPYFLHAFPAEFRAEIRELMIGNLVNIAGRWGPILYADSKHFATLQMHHRYPRAWTMFLTYHQGRTRFVNTVIYTVVNKTTREIDICDIFHTSEAPLHLTGTPRSVSLYTYWDRADRDPVQIEDWYDVSDTESDEEGEEETD